MLTFTATIKIIGINPYVLLPELVLLELFKTANKDRGPIPVQMAIDGHPFPQTLVKYAGHWRLYLNEPMRQAAEKGVGDTATFNIAYDPVDRSIPMHPKLCEALGDNPKAKEVFDSLSPYLRKEIVRYFSFLKKEETVDTNVKRAIDFLLGEGSFIGRNRL